MRYLLDTDICIYIINEHPLPVRARLEAMNQGDAAMSVISYLELFYGAWKSTKREDSLQKIGQLRKDIPVLPIDATAAGHYARIRSELEPRGRLIGGYDLMIAAHALSLGLTLVTNNTREFSRVKGLKLENWAK